MEKKSLEERALSLQMQYEIIQNYTNGIINLLNAYRFDEIKNLDPPLNKELKLSCFKEVFGHYIQLRYNYVSNNLRYSKKYEDVFRKYHIFINSKMEIVQKNKIIIQWLLNNMPQVDFINSGIFKNACSLGDFEIIELFSDFMPQKIKMKLENLNNTNLQYLGYATFDGKYYGVYDSYIYGDICGDEL